MFSDANESAAPQNSSTLWSAGVAVALEGEDWSLLEFCSHCTSNGAKESETLRTISGVRGIEHRRLRRFPRLPAHAACLSADRRRKLYHGRFFYSTALIWTTLTLETLSESIPRSAGPRALAFVSGTTPLCNTGKVATVPGFICWKGLGAPHVDAFNT